MPRLWLRALCAVVALTLIPVAPAMADESSGPSELPLVGTGLPAAPVGGATLPLFAGAGQLHHLSDGPGGDLPLLGGLVPPAVQPAPAAQQQAGSQASQPALGATPANGRVPAAAPAPAFRESGRGDKRTRSAAAGGIPRPSRARTAATERRPLTRTTAASSRPAAGPERNGRRGENPPRPNSLTRALESIPPQYRLPVFVLAGISLLLAGLTLRERRRSRSLAVRAMIDPLTGLPNREAFERRLEREWARSQRYDRGLGLLLLDLDDFKGINDAHGHLQGDRVLEDTATVIAARIRETDMAARLGGDEFVVLCPETYGEGLETLARSLEARLDEASIEASVGSAEREAGDDGPGDLIARADAEMYRRKYVAHGEVASEDEQPALLTAAAS